MKPASIFTTISCWRWCLLFVAVFLILFTGVRLEIAGLQWRHCFDAHSWENLPSALELVVPAIGRIFQDPLLLAILIATGSPYLFIIALTRSKILAGVAICVLLLVPAAPIGSPLHSCDQKACDDCTGLMLFQLVVLLPSGIAMLAFVAIGRTLAYRRERNASGITVPQSPN